MGLHNRGSLEPWIPDSVDYYQHQAEGVRRMARMRSVILADQPGLGKTLSTLTTFAIDVKMGLGQTMIVVCPVSLKKNWEEEVGKFTTFYCRRLTGTPKFRSKVIREFAEVTGPKILITNYEQVVAHLAELNALRVDWAVFDEAHMIKNPSTKRTKACKALVSTRSFLLTGTPVLNQVHELWSLLDRVTPGGWGSYWGFMNKFCLMGGYENRQVVGVNPATAAELRTSLQAVMVRRLKKDVLDLPEVQYITRVTEMHAKQRALYREVWKEMKLSTNGQTVDISSQLTKILRCKQIIGTTATVTDEDFSGKLDAAYEDATQILDNGDKLVAFTQFRGIQDAYAARLRGRKATDTGYPVWIINGETPADTRVDVVHEWAAAAGAGVLLCTIRAAGVGLNMTAARHVQLLDKEYVPGLNEQAVDRVNRIGASTTQAIQVFEYTSVGTVESRIEKMLAGKKKVSDDLIETDNFMRKIIAAAMAEDESEDEAA